MKEEVLKKMISVVDTMTSYKTDFYKYDLKILANLKEEMQFFWLCDKFRTALTVVDADWLISEISNGEGLRFYAMQNKDNLLGALIYFLKSYDKDNPPQVFYYDGEKLVADVKIHMVYDIWNPIYIKIKEYVASHYPNEASFYKKLLPVHFSCPEVRVEFIKVLKESSNPQSLMDVAKHFRRYSRCAVDECVVIGYDYCDKCFSFAQKRNGKIVMNGGIIYYKPTEDRPEHWQIHT